MVNCRGNIYHLTFEQFGKKRLLKIVRSAKGGSMIVWRSSWKMTAEANDIYLAYLQSCKKAEKADAESENESAPGRDEYRGLEPLGLRDDSENPPRGSGYDLISARGHSGASPESVQAGGSAQDAASPKSEDDQTIRT